MPLASRENRELLLSPVPLTREKVRVALVSGSVALYSPSWVPEGWFSRMVKEVEKVRVLGAVFMSL